MNPEFRRNLWLELTPRRVAFMAGVLLLIFLAAALTGGGDSRPAAVAKYIYYFIVVLWGTRDAALSVVGEIRERTWDSQRLSSLGASEMVWGKLFGSTIYPWLGGAICLAMIFERKATHDGTVQAFVELIYMVAVGVISQAAALLASLIAIGRRQTHTRLEIFVYQIVGIFAALAVYNIWGMVDPARSRIAGQKAIDIIYWWSWQFDARPFLLVSLVVFAGWILVGCYRQMRLELKMRNGPLVWLAFLVFIGLYVAGFDAWLPAKFAIAGWDNIALRLALATFTYGALTYAMVVLEPKDRVLYRWLLDEISARRLGSATGDAQAWMMSYIAAIVFAVLLLLRLAQSGSDVATAQSLIVSAMAFLTRDVALFVLFLTLPGRRRGDVAVLVTLAALYLLVPAIFDGLHLTALLPFFYPRPSVPLWLGPIVVWIEAIAAVIIALRRLALGGQPQPAAA